MMPRIFAPAPSAWPMAACASVFLIASHTGAASQAVDPGWQIVYAGQPGYGSDGLIESMFGDGTGQPVVARAYPVPPPNFQQQTATSESAPVYYQQAPAAAPARQAAPVRTAPVFAQPSRPYQPAPAYYRQGPAPQAYGAPAYYQTAPMQQATQAGSMPAWRAARTPQRDPQYTASVPAEPARGFLSAPATYRTMPAPRAMPAPTSYQVAPAPQAAYQPPAQYQPAAPQQRVAFGYENQQQQYGGYQPQQGPSYAPPQSLGYAPQQGYGGYQQQQPPGYGSPSTYGEAAQQPIDPRYERQVVEYRGSEPPGTVIIDTPHFFLYLVLDGGRALRYGIGVGRPGFTWAGVKSISAKREWPDWHPPDEMLARRPDLPRYMPGGPDNPLGARALYLGSTLYRIHGSNEPWSIGTQVSSGCIRLRNADIVDLYGRVKVGTKVIVI
jgi:lipoprotein-anchoring transpeptidase ErfK/SrfK